MSLKHVTILFSRYFRFFFLSQYSRTFLSTLEYF